MHVSKCLLVALSAAVLGCSFDVAGVGGDAPSNPDAAVGSPDAITPPPPDATPPAPDAEPADTDQDGVPDSDDNCVDVENPKQYDEDSDSVGDACDNCPTRANVNQENTGDNDEVGDVCDPNPGEDGDTIVFFEGFNDPLDASWVVGDGTATWSVSGGQLHQNSASRNARLLYWNTSMIANAKLETSMEFDTIPPAEAPEDRVRSAGLVSNFIGGSGLGTGYTCLQYDDPSINAASTALLMSLDTSSASVMDESVLTNEMTTAKEYRYELLINDDPSQECTVFDPAASPVSASDTDGFYTLGYVGLRTFGVAASFRYFIVYGFSND